MEANKNASSSFSTSSSPAELSDSELLVATRRLIGRSNQLLAALLEHLAEVEARGVHRIRACSSLYVYCIYELRLSEDEAYRRVTAARLVRRFPVLLDAVFAGELHLTGLLMLGPHLTGENLAEVLARAKHRTKKEIAGLVRLLDPLPDVPPRIEPLGPVPARLIPQAPTWSRFDVPGARTRSRRTSAEISWSASEARADTKLPATRKRVDSRTAPAATDLCPTWRRDRQGCGLCRSRGRYRLRRRRRGQERHFFASLSLGSRSRRRPGGS